MNKYLNEIDYSSKKCWFSCFTLTNCVSIFSRLDIREWLVSPLYFLPQLRGTLFIQFLVILFFLGDDLCEEIILCSLTIKVDSSIDCSYFFCCVLSMYFMVAAEGSNYKVFFPIQFHWFSFKLNNIVEIIFFVFWC